RLDGAEHGRTEASACLPTCGEEVPQPATGVHRGRLPAPGGTASAESAATATESPARAEAATPEATQPASITPAPTAASRIARPATAAREARSERPGESHQASHHRHEQHLSQDIHDRTGGCAAD